MEPAPFINDATWFNKTAFAQPAAGTFGQQPRNILRNPGFWEWDLGLRKNFPVTEHHHLQFRTELFNVVNHPNWAAQTRTRPALHSAKLRVRAAIARSSSR